MRIISIDPGLSGAWAVIVDGRAESCGDMPVSGEGAGRRVAASVLRGYVHNAVPELAVVERVGAMPKQGVASMFRFGMAYGAALAVPAVLGIAVELVEPSAWKRHFKLIGKDKEASRQKALDLCPDLAGLLRRKMDHGRAEAILIGMYAHALWGA
jgi:crossover junction endodeoxyribonuclease RuvC